MVNIWLIYMVNNGLWVSSSHGGTPSSLDGLFHGKSHENGRWRLGYPHFRKPPDGWFMVIVLTTILPWLRIHIKALFLGHAQRLEGGNLAGGAACHQSEGYSLEFHGKFMGFVYVIFDGNHYRMGIWRGMNQKQWFYHIWMDRYPLTSLGCLWLIAT